MAVLRQERLAMSLVQAQQLKKISLRWQGVACRAGRSLEEVLLEAEGGSQNMGCQGRRSGHIRHGDAGRFQQTLDQPLAVGLELVNLSRVVPQRICLPQNTLLF